MKDNNKNMFYSFILLAVSVILLSTSMTIWTIKQNRMMDALQERLEVCEQCIENMKTKNPELQAQIEDRSVVIQEKEQYEPQHDFHDIYDCVLTAYCPCYQCCSIWSPEYTGEESHTYTGTTPVAGRTVSVDPDIIPLGATVVINGHEYIAEDTGNFSGNVIDIYFDNHEDALNFGRHVQQIAWYLEEGETYD